MAQRQDIIDIINGKVNTYTFNTKTELEQVINDAEAVAEYQFKTGDIFLIREKSEPDYWWEETPNYMYLTAYDTEDIEGLNGFARVLDARSIDYEKVEEIDNRLDGLTFKQAIEYKDTNILENGIYEYDSGNNRLYLWQNNSRIEQPVDQNTFYIVREV